MLSNLEKGRRFRERCREALQRTLGRHLEPEVSISIPGLKSHKFDLVTPERDLVAECKAVKWTGGGNIPSAKITDLREAVQDLRALAGGPTLYLIIKRDPHPRRGETLAAYFVRLNKERLGRVNVLELPEEGGDLTCVYGRLEPSKAPSSQPATPPPSISEVITADDLGVLRRKLFQILDWLEGRRSREEGPAKRVSRLRSEGRIPRNIANLMHTVLGFRDAAEYEGHLPTNAEAAVIQSAWAAITEWARKHGWRDEQ